MTPQAAASETGRLLAALALGHVHHGTHELNDVAGWAENRAAHYVDISDLAAWINDSVVQFEVRTFARRSLDRSCDPGLIIRMNAFEECLESRLSRLAGQNPSGDSIPRNST